MINIKKIWREKEKRTRNRNRNVWNNREKLQTNYTKWERSI